MIVIIQETLGAKLPALLEQHPGMSEEFIRVVAQADPTGCQYVGWLLHMLEEKQWDITDIDSMRTVLEGYHRLKEANGWTGQSAIDAYTNLDDLVGDVQHHIETPTLPNDESTKIQSVKGAKQIASAGSLEVWEITTPQAAALFGCGQGGMDSPSTNWPTCNEKIAAKYILDGPLYVVLEYGQSIAQIHFGRHEARNQRNLNLTATEASKVAALFTGQNFTTELGKIPYQPSGWQLTDGDIEEYLKRLKTKFITQRKAGFFLNGKWIEPIGDQELLERRWKSKEPQFRHTLKIAQKDHDEEVIRKAGRKHPNPTGIQALANAVYDLEHG